MKKILVIDGQGGRIGALVVGEIKKKFPAAEITAVGTNVIATGAMLKAGADNGATGENPVVVAARTADVIIGPIGIVLADALFGEVTAKMAAAVGQSPAEKLLIPLNKCQTFVVGVEERTAGEYVALTVKKLEEMLL